jgi:acyl-homoserine-lactone acylase
MRRLAAALTLLALAGCMRDPPPAPAAREYHPTITRDDYGVPTIHGRDDGETAYGLAMAHAEDNFRTIQLVVLASRGRLGAYLGENGAKSDFLWNLLDVQGSVDRGYERDLSPEIRSIFTGYADGLNAYGHAHPSEVLPGAQNVTGRDVAAGSALTLPLFWGFDSVLGRVADEHGHPCAVQHATAETIDWGSNAFAVAPSRSSDHHTRVILNSHQPWDGPVAWWEARVESDTGWRMHGGLFPGAPFPVVGTNGVLGWAATVNLPDLADVYRLRTDAEHNEQYFYDGQWRRFETRLIWLHVKIGPVVVPIPKTLRFSVQGPAFQTADGWVAVRYAGAGELRALEQFYRMGRAQNFDQWRAAMAMRAIPSFNFIYGDNAGQIAYLYNASLPRRPAVNVDWSGCVPGDTSATLWNQRAYIANTPTLINPRSGWLYSTNGAPWSSTDASADMRPADYPDAAPFIETYLTNRGLRAVEVLSPEPTISEPQLEAAKFDVAYSTHSRMAAAIQTILAADSSHDSALADIQRALRAWDMRSNSENRGAALANLMFEPLYEARRNRQPEPDPVTTARSAAEYLNTHFHRLDPAWGEVLRLRHGNVDLAMDGANDALRGIRWARERDGRLNANFGDGLMMIMDWAPDHTLSVRVISQWGASSHEATPHYNDQSALYVAHGWRVQPW